MPNQQSSFKKAKTSLYENCTWGDLELGDLIYLKRNEVCPADILLLEGSDEFIQVQT
jgi:magnesium-transporting ATPase (P-type)